MTALALLLIIMSALMHASWNYLTKGRGDQITFLWATGIVGSVTLLPLLLWVVADGHPWSGRVWLGFVVGAVIRATYFLTLGAAYSRGDLSLVYPVARGIAPVLVPVMATAILGERLSAGGALGVVVVALGVYIVHLPAFTAPGLVAPLTHLRAAPTRWAAVTGVLTTTYSLVDKWNVSAGAPPFAYAYFTIPVAALLLTPVILHRPGRSLAVCREGGWRIPAVALLMISAYLLVLVALQSTQVSYVAAARELGIVFGTILGSVVLHEGATPQRVAGAAFIVAGVAMLSVAP
jgi:drug/metabolite transporter (DMT)-like permease